MKSLLHTRIPLLAAIFLSASLWGCVQDEIESASTQIYSRGNCGPAAISNPELGSGDYGIGYRSSEVVYTPSAGEEERTFTLHVWYPTNEDGPATEVRHGLILTDNLAKEDAAPAEPVDDCGFPLFVYSHGSQAFGGSALYLVHHLVSRGWVVAAPDHTGNTLLDHKSPLYRLHLAHRPLDLKQSVDALSELPADDALGRVVATDRYILASHSYGDHGAWLIAGARFDEPALRAWCEDNTMDEPTAGISCTEEEIQLMLSTDFRDSRAMGTIQMAAQIRQPFGQTGYASAQIPILAMTGTEDHDSPPVWPLTTGLDFTWLELQGGCHESFALASIFGCDTLEPELGYDLVQQYSSAFAQRYLLGDRSEQVLSLLDGSRSISDSVKLQRRVSPR